MASPTALDKGCPAFSAVRKAIAPKPTLLTSVWNKFAKRRKQEEGKTVNESEFTYFLFIELGSRSDHATFSPSDGGKTKRRCNNSDLTASPSLLR